VAEFTITTVPASGIVYLNMSHDVTITIDIPTPISISSIVTSSNMVWDLVTNDNTSSRYSLIEGKCTIHETVTRDVA
jgi:predicted transcriptional regulator